MNKYYLITNSYCSHITSCVKVNTHDVCPSRKH